MYRWSNYRANALGIQDGLVSHHYEYEALGTTAGQRQEAYRASFKGRIEPETLTELRSASNQELVRVATGSNPTSSQRYTGGSPQDSAAAQGIRTTGRGEKPMDNHLSWRGRK